MFQARSLHFLKDRLKGWSSWMPWARQIHVSSLRNKGDKEGVKSSCTVEVAPKDININEVVPKEYPLPAVIIVGAGMAGLSAAYRLYKCGLTNTLILEAKERPGGRIHSCKLGGSVVELGADLIQGANISNVAYTLASQESLPYEWHPKRDGIFISSQGVEIRPAGRTIDLFQQMLYKALYETDKELTESLSCIVENNYKDIISKLPAKDKKSAARIISGLLNDIKSEWGEDPEFLSGEQLATHIVLPGDDMRLKLGMNGLVAPLIRDIPECAIQYCKPVQNIYWTEGCGYPSRATVRCCDGDEFPCDYVISTLSIGILKTQGDRIFCPKLPRNKLKSIQKLGFGNIEKIFLKYKDPFWLRNHTMFRVSWTPEELCDKSDWIKGIGPIESIKGDNVLMFTVGGREAQEVVSLSDERIAEDLTIFLRKILNNPALPPPICVLKSRWSADMAFKGAKSIIGLGSGVIDQCEVAAPVPGSESPEPPVILFAGEATVPGYNGSVHAACMSGFREAQRIIDLTKHLRGPPRDYGGDVHCIPCKEEFKVKT